MRLFCVKQRKQENDNQTQSSQEKVDKSATAKQQSVYRGRKWETFAVNTNQLGHIKTEGKTLGQFSIGGSGETETDKCQTAIEVDDGNSKVDSVEKAEQNRPATHFWSCQWRGAQGHITLALNNTVLQQHMIDVNQETHPLVVDRDKLKELLERVVTKTEGYKV